LLISFIRTVILYTIIVIAMRIMGKRQIGEMQPFELVIAILIADLAAVPMQNAGIPLLNGITPIFTLILAQLTLSYLTLKSEKVRSIVCGTPRILIENGKILEKEMRISRCNLNDLLEQLRLNNISNVNDVEFAILETCGQISVIPKSQKRALTPEDLSLTTPYEGLPVTLVMDGKVNYKNLKKTNLDAYWLKNYFREIGVKDIKSVFIASLDSNGKIFYQLKDSG
jgi:uncharacterized membrane protein YcaP (DUF421 family)